jgi:ComF family protein
MPEPRTPTPTGHLWPALFGRLIPIDRPVGGLAMAARPGWTPDPTDAYCPRCGATAPPETVLDSGCPHCRDQPVPWDRVYRLGPYRDPIAAAVRHMKFGRGWGWAPWLGRQLAAVMPPDAGGVVCPVPLHWTRRLRRGFDQSYLIAEAVAHAHRLPLVPILRRVRRTSPQSALTAQRHRRENVRNAFVSRPLDLGGRTVWLVDDVKTTGATAGQCARLLRRAGAGRIHLLVAAVADPHGQDFTRR